MQITQVLHFFPLSFKNSSKKLQLTYLVITEFVEILSLGLQQTFFSHELDIDFRRYQKFSRQNNFSFILQIGLAMQSILRLPVIVNLCMLTFSPILVFHSKLFINPFLFVGLCNQSFYDVVVSIWHQCHSEDLSYCVRNLCIEYFNVYNLLNIPLPALCKSRKLFCFQQGRKQLSRDHVCEILVRQGKYFCCLVNC